MNPLSAMFSGHHVNSSTGRPVTSTRARGDEAVFVMSLGTTCLTARLLGEAGARLFASPLDWVFSSPEVAADVIADGGESLLDRQAYIPLAPSSAAEGGTCGHSRYSNMLGRDTFFNHHDPFNSDEDWAYFRRCCTRLRLVLASPCFAVFTIISIQRREPLDEASVQTLFDLLCAKRAAVARGLDDDGGAGGFALVVIKLLTKKTCVGALPNERWRSVLRHDRATTSSGESCHLEVSREDNTFAQLHAQLDTHSLARANAETCPHERAACKRVPRPVRVRLTLARPPSPARQPACHIHAASNLAVIC